MLRDRDTTFAPVSRAPLNKLDTHRERHGWDIPWYSSFGSDFNYDFHVTNDEKVAPVEYNYRNKAELEACQVPNAITGEEHGISVFFNIGDDVFHTYSAYARGTEGLTDARALPAPRSTSRPTAASRILRPRRRVGRSSRPTGRAFFVMAGQKRQRVRA